MNLPAPGPKGKMPISAHHLSVQLQTHQPYVCTDIEKQRRFVADETLLRHGIRSYVALPLLKHGKMIGAVDFVSFEKRDYPPDDVQLLKDVSEIVSIAVSNALAYE